MKKILTLIISLVIVSGVAFADGVDFHLGLGYNGHYNDNGSNNLHDVTFKDLDHGISAFLGLGAFLNEENTISLGLEVATNFRYKEKSNEDLPFDQGRLQLRGYLSGKVLDVLTFTLFAGVNFDLFQKEPQYTHTKTNYIEHSTYYTPWATYRWENSYSYDEYDHIDLKSIADPIVGGRIALSIVYVEYTMILNFDLNQVIRHEFGAGLVLSTK